MQEVPDDSPPTPFEVGARRGAGASRLCGVARRGETRSESDTVHWKRRDFKAHLSVYVLVVRRHVRCVIGDKVRPCAENYGVPGVDDAAGPMRHGAVLERSLWTAPARHGTGPSSLRLPALQQAAAGRSRAVTSRARREALPWLPSVRYRCSRRACSRGTISTPPLEFVEPPGRPSSVAATGFQSNTTASNRPASARIVLRGVSPR
jgi:hypothetical protein